MKCVECGSEANISGPAPSFKMRGYDTRGIVFAQCPLCEWFQWFSYGSGVLLGRESGTMNFSMDGDMWCATRIGFTNLQESNAGFGKTKREAAQNLVDCEHASDVSESRKMLGGER